MQPATNQHHNLNRLQASLDDYFDRRLEFSELRTHWIATLAEQPEMRNDAVRLIYQQPSNKALAEHQALSLKRIVEAAIHDEDNDWTVDLEDDGSSKPKEPDSKSVVTTASAKRAQNDVFSAGHVLKERFVLNERLGGGGIGVVYSARDLLRNNADGQPSEIAVKILRDEYRTKPELLSAMQSEAVWAQQLSHPNLVRVHDYHQDGDTCFLTMELLEGEPLRRVYSRLQPATMPTKKAMRIIAGMCRGLAHAHANGLVHADLKPGNVFLTKSDVPKIFDFGSAQIAASGNREKDASLKPGSKGLRAVTPAYASCNRLEGGAPGFSDDVYSLCCVIYELLAGRHPYGRKSALVARELDLRPERIDGLTDLQWRTLAMGLMPSREDRLTEVHDLLEVFDDRKPATSASPTVRKRPIFLRVLTALIVGLILGAGLLYSARTFDIPVVLSDFLTRNLPELEPSTETPAVVPVLEQANDEAPIAEEIVEAETDPTEAIIDNPDTAPEPAPTESVPTAVSLPSDPVVDIPPGFSFASTDYRVNENVAAVAIQIERQGDISEPASVQWTTFAGSAEPQVDYVSFFRKVVRFDAGETTRTILIPIVSDSNAEFIEDFRIELSRPDGDAVLAQPSTVTVTIVDDDF